jgi:hypothetical protein
VAIFSSLALVIPVGSFRPSRPRKSRPTTTNPRATSPRATSPRAPNGIELHAGTKGGAGEKVGSFSSTAKLHRFVVELGSTRKTVRYRWRFTALATLGGENVALGTSAGTLTNVRSVEGSLEFPRGAPVGFYRVSLTLDDAKPLVRDYEVND